jgi:hypothetical protein
VKEDFHISVISNMYLLTKLKTNFIHSFIHLCHLGDSNTVRNSVLDDEATTTDYVRYWTSSSERDDGADMELPVLCTSTNVEQWLQTIYKKMHACEG